MDATKKKEESKLWQDYVKAVEENAKLPVDQRRPNSELYDEFNLLRFKYGGHATERELKGKDGKVIKTVKSYKVDTIDAIYDKSTKTYSQKKTLGYKLTAGMQNGEEYITVQVSNCYVRVRQAPNDRIEIGTKDRGYAMFTEGTADFYKMMDKAKFNATKQYLLNHCNFKTMKWSTLVAKMKSL